MTTPQRIAAVTRKPDSASYEQRVLRWVEPLAELGVTVEPMTLPKRGGEQKRFIDALSGYDGVWWHRHLLTPMRVGRLRRAAKRLVFEFDDPLTFSSKGGGQPSLKRRIAFARLLRRCDTAVAGSQTLADSAARYCDDTRIVPMAVTLPGDPPQRDATKRPIELLWLGGASTQPYLEIIRGPLERLGATRNDVMLRLVAHEPMAFGDLTVDFRRWSHDEQEASLRECDIGLCPMPDTPWTRGKCPYKVLQYMAYGMAWVGSAVGENVVVAGGETQPRGLVARDGTQWRDAIVRLIDSPGLRGTIGVGARAYIAQHHAHEVLFEAIRSIWVGG